MQRDKVIIFNDKLAEFIRRMQVINSTVKDFQILMKTCEMIVSIDYTLPIQIYRSCISDPFKSQIYKKDETFFLDQKHDEYSDTMSSCGYNFDLINQLKKIWSTHSDKQKAEIWNYMIILCRLSENFPIKSLERINNIAKIF
jgi:hypothetical protein